ncbi:unnamed protein product [Effrenium voratum]|uniref:Uncharacterized protein n=1 Tax=Effrenium voratum TaxID=2562239 RepID=A0AA36N202_9DINO|nr:unnamed protein product [Effrenium voratum]CAJ1448146.1 unnamed protein product [Effrenium voratum]
MLRILGLAALSPALGEEFLSKKSAGTSARCLLRGWADDSQCEEMVKIAQDCFSWNPIDTSNVGSLQGSLGDAQGSLGDATECVLYNLKLKWNWAPELSGSGSNTGGPYDVYGQGNSIIGVDTPSGKWQFILHKGEGQGGDHGSSGTATAQSLHRGDATPAQEKDLLKFTERCFSKHNVDTSNLGALQGSLGSAIGCVLSKCEKKWGWKPTLSQSGSNTGAGYDGFGLGATVIGAETSTGKWQFVVHLKF